jgi:hypothetical protein
MAYAPFHVVFVPFPCAGSPKEARRLRPVYPGPVKSKRQPWPPLKQEIPQAHRADMREAGRRALADGMRKLAEVRNGQ